MNTTEHHETATEERHPQTVQSEGLFETTKPEEPPPDDDEPNKTGTELPEKV